MTRYARLVDGHATDALNTADYNPRPTWGQTDDALLSGIYAQQKAAWFVTGQWFIAVPDTTISGDIDNGDGSFSHPPQGSAVAPSPPPNIGARNAIVRLRAKRLSKSGDFAAALILLKTIGE